MTTILAVPTDLPTQRQAMTLDAYLKLPEGPPNFEYENGEVIPMPAPHGQHQTILGEINTVVSTYLRTHRLGRLWIEINVILPNARYYIPDLVYLSREHLDRYSSEDGKIHGVPDLVVEILSEDRARDEIEKFNVYQENAVPWYWVIEPKALTIEEYRLTPNGYLRTSSMPEGADFRPGLFPELTINLSELLADLEVES